MIGFLSRLETLGILISDGAMGTELAARGLPGGTAPELWNVENPDAVKSVHQAYIAAGSDIICTNTFGANRIKMGKFGLADRVGELADAGVKLAKECAGDVLVFASLGPTGELLEPYGELTESEARDVFQEASAAAANGGADAILFETFYDLSEAKLAVESARGTGLPVICTMTFDKGGRTMMGVSPMQAALELPAAGAAAIGANCGVGPDAMLPVVQKLCTAATLQVPVMVQPNAGLPPNVESPERMAEFALRFADLGARIVGGCCGSGPEHVAAIANALKARRTHG